MSLVKFSADQEPVVRYKHLLPIMQEQRSPRGVWSNPIDFYTRRPINPQPQPPVYQSGLHAFRHIDATYLSAAITPQQRKLLRGFTERVKDALNAVFFGRTNNKFYVLIDPTQADQFARFIVRFHLITDLDIKLVDPAWYQSARNKNWRDSDYLAVQKASNEVLDLRKVPWTVVRKLARWKLQYSPAFDGLVQYDRVDQLVKDINAPVVSVPAAYNKIPDVADKPKVERRRPVPLTGDQAKMLSSAELDEFQSAKYDYRRWCYLMNELAGNADYTSETYVRCNFYFDMKLPRTITKLLEQYGVTIKQYKTQTFLYLFEKRRPLAKITNAKSLSADLLLKLAQILLGIRK